MSDITYEDLRYRLKNEGEGYALKHYYGPNIDHEDENYSMMTALHCPSCGCDVEVWYPKENDDD